MIDMLQSRVVFDLNCTNREISQSGAETGSFPTLFRKGQFAKDFSSKRLSGRV